MTIEQIILFILFISSSVMMGIGENIIVRLVKKSYPEELQFRLSPSKRTLRKLKQEKAADTELQRKLRLASILKRISWIGFGLIFLLFAYKISRNVSHL